MYEILPYSPELEKRWDRFVMNDSVNGTFLQTRKFLNYHPESLYRFKESFGAFPCVNARHEKSY